jgi:hypothetical protein
VQNLPLQSEGQEHWIFWEESHDEPTPAREGELEDK